MNRLPIALLAALFCAAAPTFAPAARPEPLEEKTRASVDRGLKWLAARWNPAAPAADAARDRRKVSIAIPALGGLALLAADDAKPGEGPYGAATKHCLQMVLASQQESGLFAGDPSHAPMYGHAFATVLVAEAFARSKDPALKPPLERAVELIAKTQNHEGGWRYQPLPYDADVSVTCCQVTALHAASGAGIAVEANVLTRAHGYVLNCQNRDGGFKYMPALADGGSGVPRSAAAASVLAGFPAKAQDEDLDRALSYLAHALTGPQRPRGLSEGHVFYAAYYLANALWHAGGDYREKHLPVNSRSLLDMQGADGSWAGDLSNDYATAMALIALQVPEQRLLTQRADERRAPKP